MRATALIAFAACTAATHPPANDRALVAATPPASDRAVTTQPSPEPLLAGSTDYAWYSVGTAYYDPSTYVQAPGGTQALYLGTCQTVCFDRGLQAGAHCEGWGSTYGPACRKTMTNGTLASANSACGETQLYSQLGADYCCCGR